MYSKDSEPNPSVCALVLDGQKLSPVDCARRDGSRVRSFLARAHLTGKPAVRIPEPSDSISDRNSITHSPVRFTLGSPRSVTTTDGEYRQAQVGLYLGARVKAEKPRWPLSFKNSNLDPHQVMGPGAQVQRDLRQTPLRVGQRSTELQEPGTQRS